MRAVKSIVKIRAVRFLVSLTGLLVAHPVLAVVRTFEPIAPSDADRAAEVNAALASAGKGDVVRFAKGEYFFGESLVIAGRSGLTVDAEPGTVFRFRFRANGLGSGAVRDIVLTNSTDIVLRGFTCTTDNPVSASGRVVASDPTRREYDVRLEGDSRLDGTEPLCTCDTCDEDGAPDPLLTWHFMNPIAECDGRGGCVKRNRGLPYRMLDARTIRVGVPAYCEFVNLEPGHRIVFRLAIEKGVFHLQCARNILIQNVTVWRCPSICAVIAPPSSDIAFDGFRVCPAPGSKALYGSNADGIHVVGMSGTLTLKDCWFEGFGDDPLNVHGKAGEILSYDAQTGAATCAWRLFHGKPIPMDATWAAAGNELAFYDAKTFRERGRARIVKIVRREAAPAAYILDPPSAVRPAVGDIAVNTRDRPSVRISGCTVKNVRSRGFLLQSRDIDVADCRFSGIAGAAVLVAPDINNWYESGPADGLRLRNCRFTHCGYRPSACGAITVKVNHEGPIDAFPAGVHRNLSIADCTFANCGSGGTNVCIAASSGVTVSNCRFDVPAGITPVVFVNCEAAVARDTIITASESGKGAN